MLEGHRGDVKSVATSPSGASAITGGMDGPVRLWDLRNGHAIGVLGHHDARVPGLALTPDGRCALSASIDDTVRLWFVRDRRLIRTLGGYGALATKVQVSPDGRHALTCGRNPSLRIWDLRRGTCLRTLPIGDAWCGFADFTVGGGMVLQIGCQFMVRLWDIQNGRCIAVAHTRSYDKATQVSAHGDFAYATPEGTAGLLHCTNYPVETPIVTAGRLWLHAPGRLGGHWDERITARCRWCGALFAASSQVLDVIEGIARDTDLPQEASPCLELPDAAWDEHGLLSECPDCGEPLQFNPFIVDEREWLDA